MAEVQWTDELREAWVKAAPRLDIPIGDFGSLPALPRKFSSGSVGWYAGGKIDIEGQRCQVTLSIVVNYSAPGKVPPHKRVTGGGQKPSDVPGNEPEAPNSIFRLAEGVEASEGPPDGQKGQKRGSKGHRRA